VWLPIVDFLSAKALISSHENILRGTAACSQSTESSPMCGAACTAQGMLVVEVLEDDGAVHVINCITSRLNQEKTRKGV
jgi:hypothetical protein